MDGLRSTHGVCSTLAGLLVLVLVLVLACGGSDRSPRAPVDDELLDDEAPTSRRSRAPGDPDEDEQQDDDGVEIKGTRGHLDPQDIQAGFDPQSEALAKCYHARVKRLRYVGGKVSLRYTVSRDGTVKRVQIEKGDIGAWPVEKCILDIARAMTFRKPRGGEAEFAVPLDFAATQSVNWWAEYRAEEEVGDVIDALDECGQARDVWITLYVANRGVVKSVGFASPAKMPLPDEWATCAEDEIKTWVLSDPRGRAAKLSFRYKPE